MLAKQMELQKKWTQFKEEEPTDGESDNEVAANPDNIPEEELEESYKPS